MVESLSEAAMQNKHLLSFMVKRPDDCARFNSIAETMYKGDVAEFTTYFKKLADIHKSHCKATVPHTKFIP